MSPAVVRGRRRFRDRWIASLLLAGMLAMPSVSAQAAATDLQSVGERIKQAAQTTDQQKLVGAGIEFLVQRDLPRASAVFNSALKLDPTGSYVQLLNGLTYHLMGSEGDSEKLSLAEQGYQLAIQFDRSNWLARYFLGNLYLDRKQFAAAQSAFSEALLFVDNDVDVLYQLATASYYAGDPTTSAATLGRLLQQGIETPSVLRAMSMALAALNKPAEAAAFRERYRASQPDSRNARLFEERLQGWSRFHQNQDGMLKAQFPGSSSSGFPGASSGFPGSSSGFPPAAPAAPAGGGFPGASDDRGGAFPGAQAGGFPGAAPSGVAGIDVVAGGRGPAKPGSEERMVLVDVVILRTEDLVTTRRGVNLLSSLNLQFGSSSAPGFSRSFSGTETDANTGNTYTRSTSVTRAITIPALTYSLNIVNANSDSNEILARPTIAALEGVKSEFFSGSNINAAAVATGNAGGSVQLEKEIGVKLAITPAFLDKDRVRINVVAERTFLRTPSTDIGYTLKIETSKTTVNSQIVLNFGETLILSGLSEKETTNSRDGVPFLQDIPILQYLFSRQDSRAFQRSVLILLTPRRAEYVYREDPASASGAVVGSKDSPAINELRARYIDWFKPYPNLASVFHHLGATPLYREFRTGDVTLERWSRDPGLAERLHQVLDFLYY